MKLPCSTAIHHKEHLAAAYGFHLADQSPYRKLTLPEKPLACGRAAGTLLPSRSKVRPAPKART